VTRTTISLYVLLALAAGCSSQPGNVTVGSAAAPTTPDGRPLLPVTLPDLSRMAGSAQTQLRERHSAMMQVVANRSASIVDMSTAYGEMGKLLMAAQYPEPAEACFLNAQSLDPSDFRWPYYLAHLYRTQGDLAKSRTLFERALELRPEDVDALVWLGNVYLLLGLPDSAETPFAKALSLEPGSVSARYGLGRVALARNDPRRAVTYLEEVLKLDPEAAGAHYPLSQAYNAIGETARANEHLRQRREREILPADPLMVELDTLVSSPQTYETMGIRALDRKDWTGAAAVFRRGLELQPDSPSLKFRLATALNMMGDSKASESLFEEIVRSSPDYFPAQYSLGLTLQSKGRHNDAVERFSAAIKQRPDYSEARVALAASLRHLGRTEESLAQYEAVMRTDPRNTQAPAGYAMALVQLRRYQQAREFLVDGLNAHPGDPTLSHTLARLLAAAPDDRVRDGARAMTLVQALIKQGRTLELGETLAMTLAELGQFDQAASVQRDVLKGAERAGLQGVAARLTINLRLYERGEPCRTPWSKDEMP